MKNFKELRVWQKGMDAAVEAFRISRLLPDEERYGLRSQLTRAAVSIPSNIAEGSSRSSDKDYRRFLEISLGSCFEAETQLLIAERAGLLDAIHTRQLLVTLEEEAMMLHSFINRLS